MTYRIEIVISVDTGRHGVTTGPDRTTMARKITDTYSGGWYADAWTAVEQYRRVIAYAAVHQTIAGTP